MARTRVGLDSVVVEGDLLDDSCEEFAEGLDRLRRSEARVSTVDISHVESVTSAVIGLLFELWLDLFRQDRSLFLLAPDGVWRALGRIGVEPQLFERGRGVRAGLLRQMLR